MDWSTPITDLGAPNANWWPTQIVPHWRALYLLMERALQERLGQQHWETVRVRFEAHEPDSVDDANHLFRELVVGVWRLLEAFWQREAVAARARAKRVSA